MWLQNDGEITYLSEDQEEIFPEPHLHNSGKSIGKWLKQHSGVKQIMTHSWRQRSCNSIQLHQFNWVLKISSVPTVVPWSDRGENWYLYLLGIVILELEGEHFETYYPRYSRVGLILTLRKNLKPSLDVKDFKVIYSPGFERAQLEVDTCGFF